MGLRRMTGRAGEVGSLFVHRKVTGAIDPMVLILRPRLLRRETDGFDAAAVHLLHDPLRAAGIERVAGLGDLPEHRMHIPADRVVIAGLFDPKMEPLV